MAKWKFLIRFQNWWHIEFNEKFRNGIFNANTYITHKSQVSIFPLFSYSFYRRAFLLLDIWMLVKNFQFSIHISAIVNRQKTRLLSQVILHHYTAIEVKWERIIAWFFFFFIQFFISEESIVKMSLSFWCTDAIFIAHALLCESNKTKKNKRERENLEDEWYADIAWD